MLNKVIAFSINNKLIIGIFILALIGLGSYELTKLPIDAVPDITNNQVQIITVAPAYGATDIERLVTFPIEQVNSNISGLKEIRSFSRFGLSLVTLVFNDGVDIYWARQQVAEKLQKVQSEIPAGIGRPELGPVSTGLGEIYQYVVRPKNGYETKYNETELRTIQDWIVRRQLLGVKGVAEVSSFGGKLKQYHIAVNVNKLQSHNITINDVFSALEKNNQNTGGAYIEKAETALFIRSEGLIGSKSDIENIAIKTTVSGTPLFIRDVADVNIGYATRYGAMTYNDKGEVCGAVVMMLKGANSSEVIKNVKDRIVQIQKTLPEGVIIEPFLDRTKMVNNAISTVEKNLLEGALIVIFVLVLFLGNFRAGLLVASVIPLAMLFAVILMNTFGVSGNLMSLGALDFGLIIDGAVIIVEAVMHSLFHSKRFASVSKLTQQEMDGEVTKSASKMMNSAVFGQIIILIVYLPIFSLQGIEGKMFKPMAQTVAFALLGAFILSLTYIPMMSALFLSKKIKHEPNFSDKIMAKAERYYQYLLEKIINIPKIILSSVIGLFIIAVFILSTLGGEFIPALEEGDFALETRVLAGSNLNVSINAAKDAYTVLKKFPEVEKVVSKIGSGEVPTDPMPIEAQDLMIILKDKSKWTSAKTFDELANKMGKALDDIPGVSFDFQYPVQMRFNELMTGAKQDVVCKIFGENLDTLSKYANLLGKIAAKVEGAENPFIETVTGIPEIIISYNRLAIAQYNLSISDINKVVNTAFAGQSTGLVFEGERRFDLIVKLQTNQRENLEDIQNLLIPTPQGTQVPLAQLANIEIKNGPNQIQREDAKRRIVVGFNVKDRDVQSIVNELKLKVDKQIKFPTGYYITYGGAFQNLNEAKQRLMIAVPVSLALIFILLFFAFKSVKQGLIIYSAIPLSAIGGILFLALRGMPFSISAGIGFIALFGVAVLNGIVLISEFNQLKSEGITDLRKIVIMGTKTRLRPVLMTAFVASLGFLPMALSNGAGAEVQRPLATVVIGGLMVATLLTLFVLPILYLLFEKKPKFNVSKTLVCFIFILNVPMLLSAQEKINLNASIDTALKNNLSFKIEKLKANYQHQLVKTAYNIPNTIINTNYGQINSIYIDNQVNLIQTINFPTVYSNQKKVLNAQWQAANIGVNLKEVELRKAIKEVFYTLTYLSEKEKLLEESDSIYTSFLVKSELRLAKGESNILEKTTAELQRGTIKTQLLLLEQDIKFYKAQFQFLLNTETNLEPDGNNLKTQNTFAIDSTQIQQHPILAYLLQQKQVSIANTRLEKSKLMPDLIGSYNNMSMKGNGADNVFYGGANRFQSVQIGLGIPLLSGTQRARVNASNINQTIAESNYQLEKLRLEKDFQTAISNYQINLNIIEYYEQTALKNASEIIKTANLQFINGEINYLDWVVLVNQSIAIKNNYLNALKAYNDNIILVQYLIGK